MIMRIFLANVAACVAMLVTFSLPWSLVLFTRGSNGGTSWFLDFLGILAWLGIYLLPLSLVLALGVFWPAEAMALRTTRKKSRKKIRVMAWMAMTAAVYIAVPSMTNPYLAHWAVVCGSCAGVAASLVFARFIRESDLQTPAAADGNQPTSPR